MPILPPLDALLHALVNFSFYLGISIVMLCLFKVIYSAITPQDEWKLIKKESNTAAAIAFSGAILGYTCVLASASMSSVSWLDFIIWSVIGLVVQIIAFFLVQFIFMRGVDKKIEEGNIAAAVMLGGFSLAIGILNAAAMSY